MPVFDLEDSPTNNVGSTFQPPSRHLETTASTSSAVISSLARTGSLDASLEPHPIKKSAFGKPMLVHGPPSPEPVIRHSKSQRFPSSRPLEKSSSYSRPMPFIDIVSPRKLPKHLFHDRVPLGDKSAPNTPVKEKGDEKDYAFAEKPRIVFPQLHKHSRPRISVVSTAASRKSMKPRLPLSSMNGLPPSPQQRRAPQTVEIIDVDSDGETG